MSRLVSALCLIALALPLAAAQDPIAPITPIATKVTFAREIRPILAARCSACHVTGGSAPMPLTTYAEVHSWAAAIKEQVLARRMPKWHAARGFGAFVNDPTLTPAEIGLLAEWVDGGAPEGTPPPPAIRPARLHPAGTPVVIVPPKGDMARSRIPVSMQRGRTAAASDELVVGWSFQPGDPLITSALISSEAGMVGTWVPGDGDVSLPPSTAVRVRGRIRVDIRRRAATRYEIPVTPKRSVLRFTTGIPPLRPVWTEIASCGSPRTSRPAELLAVRPIVADRASVRVWLERTGSPRTIVGWFREVDPAYARTYWLARPTELPIEARLQGDAPCRLALTLAAPRSQ